MRGYGQPQPAQGQREVNMKFKVVKVVGKGSYGTVYQVQRLSDNKTYALKEMDVRSMNQAEREDAANEIRLLASVQHPNVISYNEAFLDGNRICIIMDYAPDGDLSRIIKKYIVLKRPMPEELVWKYFIQICMGLNQLHHMKILHRDIKPGNIMIMANDVVKIGDLGIAKLLSKTVAAKTQIGTPHYMPPEIWKNRPYGFQSDSWAMGCLLYEMLSLKVPFEARNVNELRTKVTRGTYPPLASNTDRDLVELVRVCLDQDPGRRPTMDQILSMPSVQSKLHLLPPEVAPMGRPPPNRAGNQVMLDTIKVPRNFQMIKGKLPPAQYGGEMMMGGMGGLGGMGGVPEEPEEVSRLPELVNVRQQQQHVPPQLQPRAIGQPLPQVRSNVPPPSQQQHAGRAAGGMDPVLLEMQAKAAMIGNVYNQYNKPPPGQAPSDAGQAAISRVRERYEQLQRQHQQASPANWYQQQKNQVSESRAAYGAFYHNPSSAGSQQSRDPRSDPRPPQQYKGYYDPNQQGGYGQQPNGYPPKWPAQGKLAPVQEQRYAQPAKQQYQAPPSKPPPWNYGGAAAKSGGVIATRGGGGYAAGGYAAAGNAPNVNVSRYPPMQWAPPRMR